MEDGVSIIVCCYNSAARIGETLEHLARQQSDNCPNWEVIVVDNNSSDTTAGKTIKLFSELKISNGRLISEPIPGLMNARMAGGRAARFSILSFIDDDNHVERQWVDKVYSIFAVHPDVSACGGSSTAKLDNPPPAWFDAFSFAFAVGKQQEQSGYIEPKRGFLWGAGISVRKEAWLEAEKNHQSFYLTGRKGKNLSAGEDSELCLFWQLKGRKLWYQHDLRFVHYLPSERINEKYMERLFRGFGNSEVVLRIYRAALNGEKLSYIRELRSAFKSWGVHRIKSFFLSQSKADPVGRMNILTKRSYYFGFITTLINMRTEYSKISESITKLKIQ